MQSFSISETDEIIDQRAELERLADETYNQLVVNFEPNKLKESIFAGFFLPRILNEVKDDDNAWLGMWKNVAGTMASPVNVISDTTGEILFRVPPIIQSSKLGVRGNPFTLKEVIQEYNLLKDNPVRNSKGYINSKLSETLVEVAGTVDLEEEIQQWEVILKRYGKLGGEPEVTEEKTSEEDDISDCLIW